MKVITKVLVGSRLHGLHNENSDYDYRGIFMHPLKHVLSPFRKMSNTHWIEGDEDNTAYELADFCKIATKGNPTILEVFYSNIIYEDSEIMKVMRENRHKFLDSHHIFEAFKGYAHNQYSKMNLFDHDARTPKFAVAYLRTLQQGIELLKTGEITPQVIQDKDFFLEVKHAFSEKHIPILSAKFSNLQQEFAETYAKHTPFTPDIEWIEDFIYDSYLKHNS